MKCCFHLPIVLFPLVSGKLKIVAVGWRIFVRYIRFAFMIKTKFQEFIVERRDIKVLLHTDNRWIFRFLIDNGNYRAFDSTRAAKDDFRITVIV